MRGIVPERMQWEAGGGDDADVREARNDNDGHEDPERYLGPFVREASQIQQQDGHLGEAYAHAEEEGSEPGRLVPVVSSVSLPYQMQMMRAQATAHLQHGPPVLVRDVHEVSPHAVARLDNGPGAVAAGEHQRRQDHPVFRADDPDQATPEVQPQPDEYRGNRPGHDSTDDDVVLMRRHGARLHVTAVEARYGSSSDECPGRGPGIMVVCSPVGYLVGGPGRDVWECRELHGTRFRFRCHAAEFRPCGRTGLWSGERREPSKI